MRRIDHLDEITEPFKKAVITIGNFDGVHIGHQALLHAVVERAEEIGGTAVAMTFEPHPVRVMLQNGLPPLITLHEQKSELIESAGIDVLITVPFTREFAQISAGSYVRDILVKKIGTAAIVVGKDYSFGRNREGDLQLLNSLSREYGFDIINPGWIQAPADPPDKRISSTRIRKLIRSGKMNEARRLLGRHYQIRGSVESGRDRGGRLLGFPTANINLSDELCPKNGVYAVTVEHGGRVYKGVANIGFSPTFDDHLFTVEVHILNFNGDIYGEKIRVNFIKRIRDEIKFDGIDALVDQIRRDIETARGLIRS